MATNSTPGTMERILRLMSDKKASDVYLSAHSPALIRINGQCVPINSQLLPADALRTTVLGWHITVGPPAVTEEAGFGLTVTVIAGVVLVQVAVVTAQV